MMHVDQRQNLRSIGRHDILSNVRENIVQHLANSRMFAEVLRTRLELACKCGIFFGSCSAFHGSGETARAQLSAFESHETLGTCTDENFFVAPVSVDQCIPMYGAQ